MQTLYNGVHVLGAPQIETGIITHNFHLINIILTIHTDITHVS